MKIGTVQPHFVAIESITDGVMCLATTHHPVYRAALAVTSRNVLISSDADQAALIASYAEFLKSLTFPIQILVQVRPLDLRGYLDQIAQRRGTMMREQLVMDYHRFVGSLIQERTLLARRFLVIVGADDSHIRSRSFWPWSRSPDAVSRGYPVARVQVESRCEQITTQLQRVGVTATRLTTTELITLWQQSFDPQREPTPWEGV